MGPAVTDLLVGDEVGAITEARPTLGAGVGSLTGVGMDQVVPPAEGALRYFQR